MQTAGELLNWHPHVHLLVTDGVFDRDGVFERFTYFDTQLIERLFRAEVLRLLMGKGLISQDIVDNLLSWRHSGFSVHGEVKVADREAAARRLAAGLDPEEDDLPNAVVATVGARTDEHIRMPAQRPEPLAHSPPLQEELLYAS